MRRLLTEQRDALDAAIDEGRAGCDDEVLLGTPPALPRRGSAIAQTSTGRAS